MSVDSERKLQNRVKGWLINDLHYTYLGNLESQYNKPVIEYLLRKNLQDRGYSQDVIGKAISALVIKAGNQADSLYQVNEEVYSLLRYGCQGVKDEHGNRITVHYIDWTDTEKNDFYVAEEVTVLRYDNRTTKRPDLVLYINGIAVGMFELKRSSVSIGEGIRQMLTNQQKENIQGFFNTMQLLMAGNEAEGLKYGVIETPEKFYLQWREDTDPTRLAKNELTQKILALQETESNRLRDGVISLCQHDRLLMLIHDFMIFDAGVKKTARHNQFFAVQAAQQRIKEGEGGIIWNTQGSGKSLIMVWLTKWIRENITDSRVVIITDRDELDDQIESLFFDVGENKVKRAKSCADLRDILNNNEYPIVCSLIHKYGHNAGKDADIDKYVKDLLANLPKDYKAKGNIIGFIDECHRTNSGKLHKAVETLMYDELKAYPGNVHIIVSGTAASAATVLAMAANRLEMTPGSLFMCHDPVMGAYGNEADLEQAMGILRACKNSIINMYCQRTWHSRDDVAAMMRATTWMDANAALQEGFIDAVMTEPAGGVTNAAFEHRVDPEEAKAKYQSWVDRHKPMRRSVRNEAPQAAPTEPRTSASDLQGRLDRLKYTY